MYLVVEISDNEILGTPVIEYDQAIAQELFENIVIEYGIQPTSDLYDECGENAIIKLEDATIQLTKLD